MKLFQAWTVMVACLLWLPLCVVAFFLSPQPAYVKLSIGAAASFIGMLVFFLRLEGR